MGDIVFDIADGAVKEYWRRVKNADPSTANMLVVWAAASGLESDAVLRTKATLAAVFAGATDEATNTGYVRKVLNAAALTSVPAPDTTNHWWQYGQAFASNLTWTAVANDGSGALGKLFFAYRVASGDPDSSIIPVSMHDFSGTPTGGDITTAWGTNGVIRAQGA